MESGKRSQGKTVRKRGRSHCTKYADRSDETVPRAQGIERRCRHWEPRGEGLPCRGGSGWAEEGGTLATINSGIGNSLWRFFSLFRCFSNNFRKNCIFFNVLLNIKAISEFTMKDLFRSRFFKSDTWPLARDLPCWEALCCPKPGITGLSECRAPWERKGQLSSPPILKDTDPLAC